MHAEPHSIPQKTSAPPSLPVFAAMLLGATALGVGAIVFFFDPGTHAFYPVCLFHAVTGWNCPGCGMTRALYALLHGNVRLALKDNALFVVLLAAAAVWGARFAARKRRGRPATFDIAPKFLLTLLGLAFLFGVLRNLPGFEWLSP